jgi:hypothetical protein
MACCAIENPTSCEIHAVICFLHYSSMRATEIHRALYAVCGKSEMGERTVRQWPGVFKGGRTNVRDVERNGRASVVSADVAEIID